MGQLVVVTPAGFVHGIYQAMANIKTAGAAGEHRVQCLGPENSVGLETDTPNMCTGDLVKWNITNNYVEPSTSTTDPLFVGRICSVYTKKTSADEPTHTPGSVENREVSVVIVKLH
ncbi:hypothetical protein CENSYa_1095 [Cenarchaeum symbiosum A]|uniref:Uncharacterized protein n=1 Tax=Cenarchaeum symbiosum (strain A) TaxID=414004 RepID=A0RWK7_CENSY|nr:hypothetical protein CENSYa_1095 [Cenarchaeum symbiosum A]